MVDWGGEVERPGASGLRNPGRNPAAEVALEQLGDGVWVVTQTNHTTRAESQRIVATRPLYRLQYPVVSQSSAEDLPQRACEIVMNGTAGRRVTDRRGTDGYALACEARIVSR
jgi:hypothetical protein